MNCYKHLFKLLLALLTCSMIIPAKGMAQQIDYQGHRGCRGLMPENTIPAMLEAIRQGVTTLEMDVVISKDKQVVVSHDPYMNADFCLTPEGKPIDPKTEKDYRLYNMDYSTIQKWDAGSKVHPKFPQQVKIKVYKPLLSELIDSVENYIKVNKLKPIRYNIETKSSPEGDNILQPEPEEFVRLLMEVLKTKKILKRTTIQSFDKRTLQVMHNTYPSVSLSFLIQASNKSSPAELIATLGFRPEIISPDFRLVTPDYLKACHSEKMKVVVWTVNEKEQIEKMKGMGVDGIISDYPDRFK
jgi:glycerophosphoryl diester phosphodiesterase